MSLSLEVLRKLPKAELHRHLDGSLRISTIIDLAREQDVTLPATGEEELRKMVCVTEDCASLEEYLLGFKISLSVLQKPYAITRTMYEVCEDAVNDGVRYIEVRFSPILHVNEGMCLTSVMEAICEGQAMAEHRLPITARVIVCGMRHMSPTVTKSLAEVAWRYRHKGVAAFDLAGPEDGFSSHDHKEAFALMRRKCINITLHAGEGAGWESVWDAIHHCGAHRIGHGVRLVENQALFDYVVDHRIPVEVCPTSNLQTKAVARLEDHPARRFFDSGVRIVPCCDNATVSDVTLSGEYALLQSTFQFTPSEIVRIIDYGFQSAFISQSDKERMRAEAFHACVTVLSRDVGLDITSLGVECDDLAAEVGVDFSEVLDGLAGRPHPFWEKHVNPDLSLELVRALPKTDMHCRFDGSVSVEWVWNELQAAGMDPILARFGIENASQTIKCAADLRPYLTLGLNALCEAVLRAKSIMRAVLQTEAQLAGAVSDILECAMVENVTYLELVVRPGTHAKHGLSADDVMDAIVTAVDEVLERAPGMTVGIVVYVSTNADDACAFQRTAELAVKWKERGVVGVGWFGDDDLSPATYECMGSTFEFLKQNHMNVVLAAGRGDDNSYDTLVHALHDGRASRISGAFNIHRFPKVLDYFANHGVPVELSLTETLAAKTRDVSKYMHPFRLLVDNLCPVAVCSLRNTLTAETRSELYLRIAQECKMTIAEFLWMAECGFRHNFQRHSKRVEMVREFWRVSEEVVAERGFRHLRKRNFFPAGGRGRWVLE
eukprot:TRINITY_DN5322_c0_g1_i1.p1 TRINITY_DN5322_c0_g1~~TRINITY_DN5322_c0_g1_i1.p1  ORF type:complete len:817 (-),score=184.20 TRINITY_DN5322_c0_g1_i1:17-2344(-)